MDTNSTHINHRQRMYERYQKSGLDSFAPHEALELMLYYVIPRKDVNPLAHDLIETFGSFSNVLDAHPDDLIKVSGVSQRCAVYLNMLPKIMRLYNTQKAQSSLPLDSAGKVIDFLSDLFYGWNKEVFYLLCLDAKCSLTQYVQISIGETGGLHVHPKKVVEAAIRYNSSQVIFAHNHPSGMVQPSEEDILFTRRLAVVMSTIDIPVIDHVILNDTSSYSFARQGEMQQINKDVNIRIASPMTKYSII